MAVAALALLLLAYIDAGLKAGPPPELVPEEADWIVWAPDFPTFWNAFETNRAYRQLAGELNHPLHRFELAAYEASGMRPTPIRWRAWLGSGMVLGSYDGAWGASVRPGLLMRLASMAHRVVRSPDGEGIRQYRELHYAWRDGELVISRDPEYVRAALSNIGGWTAQWESDGPDQIMLRWDHAGGGGELRLTARDPLSVSGWISPASPPAPAALRTATLDAAKPLVAVHAGDWRSLVGLYEALPGGFERSSVYRIIRGAAERLWLAWDFEPLPGGWDDGLTQASVALTGFDHDGPAPDPELAFAFRRERPEQRAHPWRALYENEYTVTYEWGPVTGEFMPVLGERFSLCFARYDDQWFVTTREPLMADLMLNATAGAAAEEDLLITMNWNELAEALEDFLPELAEYGLLGGMDRQDVAVDVTPHVNAAGALGAGRIQGVIEDGRIEFRGALTEPEAYDGEPENNGP